MTKNYDKLLAVLIKNIDIKNEKDLSDAQDYQYVIDGILQAARSVLTWKEYDKLWTAYHEYLYDSYIKINQTQEKNKEMN